MPRTKVYDQIDGPKLQRIVKFALSKEGKEFKDKAKKRGAFEKEYAALLRNRKNVATKYKLKELTEAEQAYAMGWADFGFGPGAAELPDSLLDAALNAALEYPPGG